MIVIMGYKKLFFSFFFRKICKYCKCSLELYDMTSYIDYDRSLTRYYYDLKRNFILDDDSGCFLEEYVWVLFGFKFE